MSEHDHPDEASQSSMNESEAPRSEPDRPKQKGRTRRTFRKIMVWVLVVLTCVGVVATGTAFWARATLFDTDRFVALVEPVVTDPAVQQNVATRLTDQIFQALDVQGHVAQALPGALASLAGPIAASAHDFIQQRVQAFLASDTFQQFWAQATTVLHQKIVALLKGDTSQLPNVVISSGEVRISLISAAARILQDLAQQIPDLLGINVAIPDFPAAEDPQVAIDRLSSLLGKPLPSDFGQITVMTVDQLESLQTATGKIERLPWLLLVVTLLLMGAALALSLNRRRTVIALGIGVALAFLVTARVVNQVEGHLLAAVESGSGREALQAMLTALLGSLRAIVVWALVLGVLAAIVAFLAGKSAWFGALRRKARTLTTRRDGGASPLEGWLAAHADWLRVGGIAVAVVALFLWGLSVLSVLVVGGLLGLYLWGLVAAEARVGRAAAGEGA